MSVYQGALVNAAWPVQAQNARTFRAVVLVVLGSLLMTAGAKVQVPFYPVPTTMQTFALMLIIASCGSRLAAGAVGFYLLQGLAGLPVFAYSATGSVTGPAYFTGTTGGYLVGFLVAAAVGGWLVDRWGGRGVIRLAGILAVSLAIVYACGVPWLASLIGVPAAIEFGFVNVILGDIAKLALAVALTAAGWQVVKPR